MKVTWDIGDIRCGRRLVRHDDPKRVFMLGFRTNTMPPHQQWHTLVDLTDGMSIDIAPSSDKAAVAAKLTVEGFVPLEAIL